MGFFRDIATLNKVGKEMSKDWDSVAHMAQGRQAMAEAVKVGATPQQVTVDWFRLGQP